jgi:replicative DNA helicase Mcm
MSVQEEPSTVAEKLIVESFRDQVQEFGDGTETLLVDYQDVVSFNVELSDELIEHPDKSREVIADAAKELEPQVDEVNVRIRNLSTETDISDLRAKHVNRLVSFKGVVRNATPSREKCLEATFECARCGTLTNVKQNTSSFQEPHQCDGCERKGPFRMLEDQSDFVDWQKLRVSEPLSKGDGEPESINIRVEGEDIVKTANPGDRVEVTGIPRTYTEDDDVVFEKYIEGVHVEKLDKDAEDIDISDEEMERIQEIAENEPLKTFSENIATSIRGYENIKKAAALQLVGGVEKELPDDGTERGTIHVGVVGDPGTGKSKILSRVADIAPRSVSTSGEGSSAAGLTAAAVESDFDGRWSIKAGALVLADGGVACIDELDKMDASDRNNINKALSDGVVQISKAGRVTEMPSACSVFAAANPKYGRFDEYESIEEQIELSDELLSRFDLLFTTTDNPEEEEEREILQHLHEHTKAGQRKAAGKGTDVTTQKDIETGLLQKYVAYAKDISPVATDGALKLIEDFMADVRSAYQNQNDSVPITLRKDQAIIRLAEAHARLRLSDTVEVKDAEVAVKLTREHLDDVAKDPETGEYDADRYGASHSKAQRDVVKEVKEVIDKLVKESDDGTAPKDDIIAEVSADRKRVVDQIDSLRRSGEIAEVSDNEYRGV